MNSVAGELQRFKAEFFRALAHPIRIEILEVLLQGERSVHELQEILDVDQPVVSQQLAVLRAKHIVAGRTYGEIARDVVLSEKTVSSHVPHLLRRTGAANRVDLARLATHGQRDVSG